jgi:hypothetical protein
MENVVYILGAGFSAPLGLPVMKNFLSMSKDMYSTNPDAYKHFNDVFSRIERLNKCKTYFETDLLNIEEILSILEMEEVVRVDSQRTGFIQFISDVIKYYTPKLISPNLKMSNWWDYVFGDNETRHYCKFVGCLCGLILESSGFDSERQIHSKIENNRKEYYSIITLNYDNILEEILEFINSCYPNFTAQPQIRFDTKGDNTTNVSLAKLHGCISLQNIIAPTWNKVIADEAIKAAWKLAYKRISEANHVRIIGYSFPPTDTYIKYLFEAAVLKSENLKTIDCYCLDQEGIVKKRFDEFVVFRDKKFISGKTEDYLSSIHLTEQGERNNKKLFFNDLESAHKTIFSKL